MISSTIIFVVTYLIISTKNIQYLNCYFYNLMNILKISHFSVLLIYYQKWCNLLLIIYWRNNSYYQYNLSLTKFYLKLWVEWQSVITACHVCIFHTFYCFIIIFSIMHVMTLRHSVQTIKLGSGTIPDQFLVF